MRKPDTSLFYLIKSLPHYERENFIVWARSAGRTPKYLELFFFIEKMEIFDQKKIINHFPKNYFSSNISVSKKALFKAILRSLREMGTHRNPSVSINIEEIEILIRKDLIDSAYFWATNAKKKAEKEERFSEWLILSKHERFCLTLISDKETYDRLCSEIEKKEVLVRIKRDNLEEYERLVYGDYSFFKNLRLSSEEIDLEILKSLEKSPILETPARAESIRALEIFHSLKRQVYHYSKRFKKATSESEVLINLYDKHPFLKESGWKNYLAMHGNLVGYKLMLGDKKAAQKILDKLLRIGKEQPANSFLAFHNYYYFKISGAIDNHFSHLSTDELKAINTFLSLNNYRLKSVIIYYYYFLSAYFWSKKDLQNVRIWAGKILNKNWKNKHPIIIGAARIYFLLVAFEASDFESFESSFRNSQRYFENNHIAVEWTQSVLAFLKKNFGSTITEMNPSIIVEFKRELDTIKEKTSPLLAEYIDVEGWLFPIKKN